MQISFLVLKELGSPRIPYVICVPQLLQNLPAMISVLCTVFISNEITDLSIKKSTHLIDKSSINLFQLTIYYGLSRSNLILFLRMLKMTT